jgi:hypothetical protein
MAVARNTALPVPANMPLQGSTCTCCTLVLVGQWHLHLLLCTSNAARTFSMIVLKPSTYVAAECVHHTHLLLRQRQLAATPAAVAAAIAAASVVAAPCVSVGCPSHL